MVEVVTQGVSQSLSHDRQGVTLQMLQRQRVNCVTPPYMTTYTLSNRLATLALSQRRP